MDNEGKQSNFRFRLNLHVILIAAILIILGISVFKLVRWNIGTKVEYDPNTSSTAFDVEALDVILPMDPDRLKGFEDDGVTTILCLGNDPFSDETGENGLAALIAKKTGATVYNGAFPSSRIGVKNNPMNDDYLRDYFNLYGVAQSISTGDFSRLNYAASFESDPRYGEAASAISNLDYDKVDVLAIMYDGIDYIEKVPVENLGDPYDLTTYTGSLRSSLEAIQEKYPHVRIIVMSHTFGHCINEEGNFENGGTTDLGNGTLPHYLQKEVDVAMDCSVSIIDNYYGTVNEDNYLDYMTDYIHLNDAGREAVAQRFVDALNKYDKPAEE